MNIQQKTDVGRVRSSNQDAMTVFEITGGHIFAAVCDGMGGANGGNIASSLCIQTLEQCLRAEYRAEMSDEEVQGLLAHSIEEASATVYRKAKEDTSLQGMGTTAVAALVRNHTLILANVGDSRAVLFRDQTAQQLTKDHSYVQSMVDSGKITAKEAATHPKKNIITRAVGVHNAVEADTFVYEFRTGDLLLLCSDGLTNELTYETLCQLIADTPREQLAEEMIAQANAAGGRDNSTVVLIED